MKEEIIFLDSGDIWALLRYGKLHTSLGMISFLVDEGQYYKNKEKLLRRLKIMENGAIWNKNKHANS